MGTVDILATRAARAMNAYREALAEGDVRTAEEWKWVAWVCLDMLWRADEGAQQIAEKQARLFDAELKRKRNEDWEDMLSPLFEQLSNKIVSFPPGEPFAPWWWKVSGNCLIDRIRVKCLTTVSAEDSVALVEDLFDRQQNVVSLVCHRELIERVDRYCRAYVDEAPESKRELRAREVETWRWLVLDDIGNATIAAIHQVSPQVVSQRARRVRTYLQKRLKEDGWGGGSAHRVQQPP